MFASLRASGRRDAPHDGGAKALVQLSDGATIAGELPPTAARMVRQWALARKPELQDNWQRALVHQPLEKIAGPDDDE
jgi:Domain of unknown function (DUF4160)